MKPPVSRCLIFFFTVRTHFEISHARSFPIVREGTHHRESGPTNGACRERIKESAVVWVKQFFDAFRACIHIRWNRGGSCYTERTAFYNKFPITCGLASSHDDRVYFSRYRNALSQTVKELSAVFFQAFYFNGHSV